jgi:hypothetical protein
VKEIESDTPTARSICEKIEREGGGMVDNGVIKTALKQGWLPIPNKILWSNGDSVSETYEIYIRTGHASRQ